MIKVIVTSAVALLLAPNAASAQGMGAPPVVTPYPSDMAPPPPLPPSPLPSSAARGYDAPGADAYRSGYQRPGYGYTLPRQWIAPAYYLGDFDAFDLPVPAAGFGWSRYYDDAVLTDRFGRVYDVRYDFERDRGRRDHGRHHRRRHGDDGYAYGPVQPHWDMGYLDGHGAGYGAGYGYGAAIVDCGCGETVTTTTTTRQPGTTRRTRYRTVSYETVGAAPRVVRPPARGKYVRVAR